jgi:hypothetical protein
MARVLRDRLPLGGKPARRRQRRADQVRDTVGFRPDGQERPQVEQRIAEGGHLPVDDRGDFRAARGEHDVGKVVIAVKDARPALPGPAGFQPGREPADAGQVRARVPVEAGKRFQLAGPAAHLAFQEPVGLPEAVEPGGGRIHLAQERQGPDRAQAHRMALGGVRRHAGRQLHGRVVAVDRLHEIEHRVAQDRRVRAGRDQAGVRDVRRSQGRHHRDFPEDVLVAPGPQVPRAPAQDVIPAAAPEAQHHVLGASGQGAQVLERPGPEPGLVHPRGDGGGVHGAGNGVRGHGRHSARPVRRWNTPRR